MRQKTASEIIRDLEKREQKMERRAAKTVIPTWLKVAITEAEARGARFTKRRGSYIVTKTKWSDSIYQVKGLGRVNYFFYEDVSVLDDEVTLYLEAQLKKNPLLYVSEEDLNDNVKMRSQYKRILTDEVAERFLEDAIYPLEESGVYRIADLDPAHFDIEEAYAKILDEKKVEIERVLDKYPILYPMEELDMSIGELLREVDMDIVGLIQVIQDEHPDYLEEGPRGNKVTYLKSGAVVVTER
jgi:hypothetical protein